MKLANLKIRVMTAFAVMLVSFGGFAWGQDGEPPVLQAGVYDAQGETVVVVAQGLVCDFCAKALEKVFMKRAEVSGMGVDLSRKEVVISLKAGQTLDDATIAKLIEYGGYTVSSIRRHVPNPLDEDVS